jgi:XTP/dITP diphosphohydrolase
VKTLLLATQNPGKLEELAAILNDLHLAFKTPAELGLTLEVAETGDTYAENARLKALAFAQASGLITLGDDSGLEVEALSGAPGLFSARYAGPGANDAHRRAKLLQELRHAGGPAALPLSARFCCVVAIAQPAGALDFFEGVCEGEIIFEERGANGFGYDPIFYLPEYQRTMAELPSELKNRISHRGRAVLAAEAFLRGLLSTD